MNPAAGDGFERDEATGIGLLDRRRISDAPQRRQFDGLPHSQRVDHIAYRRGQGSDAGFDQFNKARRHDGITEPAPVPVPLHDSAVSDVLFHDVAQIQNVAAC